MNQDLSYQDLIFVIDEAYEKTDKLGRPIVDSKTGEYFVGSKLEDARSKHLKGEDVLIDYMWRGEQSRINFFLLTKVNGNYDQMITQLSQT